MKPLYVFLISISLLGMVMLGEPLDISSSEKQVLGDEDIQQVFEKYPFVLDYLDGIAINGDLDKGQIAECHQNISCQSGTVWDDVKRSVVKLWIPIQDSSTNGGRPCTGFFINNANPGEEGEPYLITARHCVWTNFQAEGLCIFLNYETTACSNSSQEDYTHILFGGEIIASSQAYDYTLLRLKHSPPVDANPYFSGLDFSGSQITSSTAIHHPQGNPKKITHSSIPPETEVGINLDEGDITSRSENIICYKYRSWDYGTIEGGSSGGPLFDQNQRVIGICHGMRTSLRTLTLPGLFNRTKRKPIDPCEFSPQRRTIDHFLFQGIENIWSAPPTGSANLKSEISPSNYSQTFIPALDLKPLPSSYSYDSYEPNDLIPIDILDLPRVFSTKTKINEGDLFHAEISSSTDVDHYLVSLRDLGSLNITMTPPAGKNYNLEILDASGIPTPNQPLPGGSGQEEIGTYSKTNSGQTLLIIKVTGEGGANSNEDYELSFSFTENCVPNDPNDPAEDLANASSYFGQPLSNASLAQSYQGYISSATDQDFISFGIQGGGLLNISLQNLGANYDIELQDAQGGIITSSTTPGIDGEQISEYWPTDTNTTAYLRIFGVNGAFDLCNAYDLNVSWTPGTGCPNTSEPNDSRQLALTNLPDLDLNPINNFQINAPLFQQDEDFYKLNVEAEGTLTVDLINLPADYEVRLLDNNGNIIASDPQLGTTPEQVTFAYTSQSVTTTFYLQVVGINGAFDECSPYQISLNWNPTSSCLDNFEPNDDLASSSNTLGSLGLVASNQIIQSKIRTATDKDFFAVELLEEGTLTLDLTNLPLDYDLFLYDDNNVLLASGTNTGVTSEQILFPYSTSLDATFYVVVEGKSGVFDPCNSYQLGASWVPLNACSPPIAPPDLTIPGAPNLPGLLVSTTTPTFEWIPIPGATTYELRIFEINNTSSTLIYSECVGPSPFTLPSGVLEGGKQYKWDLQGTVDCGTCVGPTSGVCYFQVDPALAPSCTGVTTLSAFSGIISDGSGPDNYDNNSTCAWLIDVPGATSINLSFTEFEIENNYDFVAVIDGNTLNDPILGIYTGANLPPDLRSSDGEMLVVFISNSQFTMEGWSANYTARFAEVTEYEYWFDDDYANKVNSSAGLTGGFLDTQLPTTGLSPGLHALNIRLKDDLAQWSSVISQYFQKLPEHSGGVPKIVGYEYWFDDDYTNHITVNAGPSQGVITMDSLDATSLPSGLHAFHIRYKDEIGNWSSVISQYIHKIGNPPPTLPNLIVGYRYFFDQADSAMVTVKLPTPINPLNLITNIDATSVLPGTHTIHLQFEDTAHYWSSVLTDTFTRIAAPRASFSTLDTFICLGSQASFTNNSTEADQFLWDFGDGASSTQSDPVHTYTSGGLYTVRLIATNTSFGVSDTLVQEQLVQVSDIQVNVAGANQGCFGDTLSLVSTGASNYSWISTANLSQTTGPNVDVILDQSAIVQVIGSNSVGCADTVNYAITVDTLPSPPTLNNFGNVPLCQGDTLILTGPSGLAEYLWSSGDTTSSISVTQNGLFSLQVTNNQGCVSPPSAPAFVAVVSLPPAPTIDSLNSLQFCQGDSVTLVAQGIFQDFLWSTGENTPQITVSTSQTVTVTSFNFEGCQSLPSSPVQVVVSPNPAPPTISASGSLTFCDGEDVTLSTSGGFAQYDWSNGDTTSSILVNQSGSFWVDVIDQNGCSSINSDTINVIVNPNPVAPSLTANGALTFCNGEDVTLSIPTGFTQYNWSNGDTTASILVDQSGSYWVSVVDQNGCSSENSDTANVVVNPLPSKPSVSATGLFEFCEGGNVILTGQSNLSTYNWSNGDTTASILVDQNGSFWLNVTDSNGCSSENSDTVNVIVNPLPPVPSINANEPLAFCPGEQVILSGPVGYTYLWSTGDTTEQITISDSIQISLIVTDVNGCSRPSTDTLQTQVFAQPIIPTISLGGASEFCEGYSVDLSSTPAFAYNWSTGDTTQQITVSLSGIYALVIENADGCQSDSAFSPQIVVNPLPAQPTIQANGPLEFCEGDSVILSAPQGFTSYLWSTGDSTDQLIIKESGVLTLEVTDANGCKSPISDTTFVNVSPQPDTPFISVLGSTLFCEGGSVILEATPGGAGSYQWTNGDATDVITVGISGSYSVWVESNEGCISFSPDTVEVTVIARPDTPLIQPLGIDSLISSVSGDRYEWYQDGILLIDSTQAIQASATGEYVVIVFNDSCGSAPSDTFSFVVSSLVSQYESDIQLYPNPSEKTLFIQGNGLPEGELELKIYDARGREVLRRYVRTKDGGLSTRVEVSSWARSVYQVSLTSADREILYLGKFMKE